MKQISLLKWPVPRGYSIQEACMYYDEVFYLNLTIKPFHGPRKETMQNVHVRLYPEQVLEVEGSAYGAELVTSLQAQLDMEDTRELEEWTL